MTLTLNVTPELLAKLSRYAQTVGKARDSVVAEMIETLPEAMSSPDLGTRVLGLHAGNILWIANDFDDPLPDEYWDSPIFPETVAEAKPA